MNPLWTELAARAEVTLDDPPQQKLDRYLDLLLDANQRMNLTRISDRAAAERLHVADALTLLPLLPARPHRLADVGSGGGVPGIVLAIARPDIAVTLIESTAKKAEFLRAAAAELGLGNVKVEPIRAEAAGRGPMRETFAVATARAVATMPWLVEWMLPLLSVGGVMLAMKGPRVAEEMPAAERAVKILGGGSAEIIPTGLPGQESHLVVRIAKKRRTDRRYPRPATAAGGRALGE